MAEQNLVQRILGEPEVKREYEKMTSCGKFLYKAGLYVLYTRKKISDSQPKFLRQLLGYEPF